MLQGKRCPPKSPSSKQTWTSKLSSKVRRSWSGFGGSRERETCQLSCQKLGGVREDGLGVAGGEHGVTSQGL